MKVIEENAENRSYMKPQDIKAAYAAHKTLNVLEAELSKLEDMAARIETNEAYNEVFRSYKLGIVMKDIRYYKARIAEEKPKLERVLSWAEEAPDQIREIIRLRVIKLKSWAEISAELFSSQEQNTAYMRLKRYLGSN